MKLAADGEDDASGDSPDMEAETDVIDSGQAKPLEVEASPATADNARNEFLNDVTQLYLDDIGGNPLLTAEEELALSRSVVATSR